MFFFKQETAYVLAYRLVGSKVCMRDRRQKDRDRQTDRQTGRQTDTDRQTAVIYTYLTLPTTRSM